MQKSGPVLQILLIFRLLQHHACCGQAQEESFTSACESSDPDTELTLYRACLTEAQQLFRSRIVHRLLTVSPPNHTCGDPPAQFCRLGFSNSDCSQMCNTSDPSLSHTADFAVDAFSDTWWQSISWLDYPQQLLTTYTISFNKLYRLTDDLIVTFNSGRPREMVIERSTDNGLNWLPWQYYAKDCQAAYSVPASLDIGSDSEAVICSQLYSDILPYSGGQVVFDVISRYQLYLGSELNNVTLLYQSFNVTNWQRFLKFTDIRLRLLQPATDGEEVNGGFNLFRYYYAISDIHITAECSCNLHSSTCSLREGQTVCDCQHNTAGDNCELCLPMYNNRKWRPGYYLPIGTEPANECQKCECYEHADSCLYNETLGYGECADCRDNTVGASCDQCNYGYYVNSSASLNDTNICIDCGCDLAGTINSDIGCDTEGRCSCESHATGDKCDKCVPAYYGLQDYDQCQLCSCSKFGVVPGSVCDDITGQCECKNTTHTRTCHQCKQSYYSLPTSFEQECMACSCLPSASLNASCDQITGQCSCLSNIEGRMCDTVGEGYYVPSPISEFKENATNCSKTYEVESAGNKFSGYHLLSCDQGQSAEYSITVSHHNTTDTRSYLFGVSYKGLQENTTLPLSVMSPNEGCIGSEQLVPNTSLTSSDVWTTALSNVSEELHNNCTYTVRISNLNQRTLMIDTLMVAVDWSELSYASQSEDGFDYKQCYDWIDERTDSSECERLILSSMSEVYQELKACECDDAGTVPGTQCDPYGGQCQCQPGVKGHMCDECMAGYHSLTNEGCHKCDCDDIGSEHSVCDHVNGQCVCEPLVSTHTDIDVYGNHGNTRCEVCSYGSYNLSESSGCMSCSCNLTGSVTEQCNLLTGECACKSGVGGDKCDQCLDGFYSLSSEGCRECGCDGSGSISSVCDKLSGACSCKDNTEGRSCSECSVSTFSLSSENTLGCAPCYCSDHGVGTCLSASGYQSTVLLYDNMLDVGTNLSFQTLLPSYGHVIRFYVTSPNTALSVNDVVLTLDFGSNSTLISYRLGQSQTSVGLLEVNAPLIESSWYTEDNIQVDRITFQSVLQNNPTLLFDPDLVYTSISVTIATNQSSIQEGVTSLSDDSTSVEHCTCAAESNTDGLSCEKCKSGYKREDPSLGSLSRCVPCGCSGLTNGPPQCDPQTGVCLNCRVGTSGSDCGSCDSHVTGDECDTCEEGYWGLHTVGRCEDCDCDLIGSHNTSCDQLTGQCDCKDNVEGVKCNSCALNHHLLSDTGCSVCEECYSLIHDKSSQLTTVTSHIEIIRSEASRAQSMTSRNNNLTFTQSVESISSQLNLLNSELLGTSQQEGNITEILSTWSYLLLNSSESQSESQSSLRRLNDTLRSVGIRLGEFDMLGRWINESLNNDSASLTEFSVKISNLSLTLIDEKLSLLDEILLGATNLTEHLNTDIRNLTAVHQIIESVESDVSNSESILSNLIDLTKTTQDNISIIMSDITDKQLKVGVRFDSFNSSMMQLIDFLTVINQSLSTLLQDQPIRDQNTYYNISELLIQTTNTTQQSLTESGRSLQSSANQSLVMSTTVIQLLNDSVSLRDRSSGHMSILQGLYSNLTQSLQTITDNEEYVEELVRALQDFTHQINATDNLITESLNELSSFRNSSQSLLNDTERIMNRTRRAQIMAAQVHRESNDLFSRATSEFEAMESLAADLQNLTLNIESLPAAEYSERISSVIENIILIHNDTCVLSLHQLNLLKDRYNTVNVNTEARTSEADDITTLSSRITQALNTLEVFDHEIISGLMTNLDVLSSEADLSSLIEFLSHQVESQNESIQSARSKLLTLQSDLNTLLN